MNSIIDHQRDQEIMKDPHFAEYEKAMLNIIAKYNISLEKQDREYLNRLRNRLSIHDGLIGLIKS